MRVKREFVLREVAGEYIIITMAQSASDFNGIITVNEIGKYLWEHMHGDFDEDMLAEKLLEEYDVDRETALADVTEFLTKLKKYEIVVK